MCGPCFKPPELGSPPRAIDGCYHPDESSTGCKSPLSVSKGIVKTEFLKPRLVGHRFEEHSIPVEVLKDWAAFEGLIKRGVIVRPTRGFGAPTAIRVTIGWPYENDRFLHVFADVLPTLPSATA